MRRGGVCLGGLLVLVAMSAGCAPRDVSVVQAFPPEQRATPWVLVGRVWSGPYVEARPQLGERATLWEPFGPQHVWLATYIHQRQAGRDITIRMVSFENASAATDALESIRPEDADEFRAGDGGFWITGGVAYRWGRLVVEVWGPDTSSAGEVAAARMVGYIQNNMPAGMPDDPK